MHEIDVILALAGALTAALALGYLTHRLGLSPIAGYLAAGILVGPYTPGFVADPTFASQLAEVGVVLLMFGVGLQFHLEELLSVGRVVVPGALAALASTAALGATAAHAFGWTWPAAAVLGLALSVASTVVLVRILADRRTLHTPAGHLALGWLVGEDLITVVALVLLPGLFAGPATAAAVATAVGLTLLKVAALVALAAYGGTRVIPAMLDRVAATRSRELFTLAVLVVALGIAALSARLFGVSIALGAFLAGMVVGRSDFSLRAATDALPMRDAFAVLFFVSVGMLFDPAGLALAPGLTVTALAVVVIGKPVVAALLMRLLGERWRTAITVAPSLGQAGEFSFILTSLGIDLGALPASAMPIVVAVSIGSIVLNPFTTRLAASLARGFARRAGQASPPDAAADGTTPLGEDSAATRAVVVGYGPTGRTVTRLLRDNGIAVTVVDLNMQAVQALRSQQCPAVYGDGSQVATLEAAGIADARTFVVTTGDADTLSIVRAARQRNPRLHVTARVQFLREAAALRAAGADGVFSGEGEVALALTEAVLRRLGATPDQIDRERARVHDDLNT